MHIKPLAPANEFKRLVMLVGNDRRKFADEVLWHYYFTGGGTIAAKRVWNEARAIYRKSLSASGAADIIKTLDGVRARLAKSRGPIINGRDVRLRFCANNFYFEQ